MLLCLTTNRLWRLFLETDGLCLIVHGVENGNRLQMVAGLSQKTAPSLLPLFDSNANAYHLSTCLMHNVDERHSCLAIGKEIVDDKYLVGSGEVRT